MDIELLPFSTETNITSNLIRKFWYAHSHYEQSIEDSLKDLKHWTGEGHLFYLINMRRNFSGRSNCLRILGVPLHRSYCPK